jgi:hypothetical protein
MAQSAMTQLLQFTPEPEALTQTVYDAAAEAYRRGWTYMEATFQLGQRAEQLGLEREAIEELIRSAFDTERRKLELAGAETADGEVATEETPVPRAAQKRTSRYFNLDTSEIPWPADAWRKDLARLVRVVYAHDELAQLRFGAQAKPNAFKIADLLAHENDLPTQVKKYDNQGIWVGLNTNQGHDHQKYRHMLLEVVGLELGRQLSFFRTFNLPCSAIVNCAGRSLQAWIRVDARSREEFEERGRFLQRTFGELGFELQLHDLDSQVLAWAPGVMHGGKQAYLLDLECGAQSWEDWKAWADSYLDGDPLVEPSTNYSEIPQKSLELVEGFFRTGHRVAFVGDSGTGKTLSLVDLALSVAQGDDWLGWHTEEGRVLFVNLESDAATLAGLCHSVATARGFDPVHERLDFLQLLGVQKSPGAMAEFLLSRLDSLRKWEKKRYSAVLIDAAGRWNLQNTENLVALGHLLDRLCVQGGVAVVLSLRPEEGELLAPWLDAQARWKAGTSGTVQLRLTGRYMGTRAPWELEMRYPALMRR